jgi:hypothetical protein
MADDTVAVRITGDASSAVDAFKVSEEAATRAINTMKDKLTELGLVSNEAATETATSLAAVAGAAENVGHAAENMGKGVGLGRMQLMELGHVGKSAFDALAAGASPMRVLGFEAGRIAQVIGSSGGLKATLLGLVELVGGPWVVAFVAGTAALVGLALWLGKSTTESKVFAESAGDLARAHAAEKNAAISLTDALAVLDRAYGLDKVSADEAREASRKHLEKLIQEGNEALNTSQKLLLLAQARLEAANADAVGGGSLNSGSNYVAQNAADGVQAMLKRLADEQKAIANARAGLAAAGRVDQADAIDDRVAAKLDAKEAATQRYTNAQGRLRKEMEAGKITAGQYEQQLEKITRARDADLESASAADRKPHKAAKEKAVGPDMVALAGTNARLMEQLDRELTAAAKKQSDIRAALAVVEAKEKAAAALDGIAAEEEASKHQFDMGKITYQQLIQAQIVYANQRKIIAQQMVQDEIDAVEAGPNSTVKLAQLHAQLLALERQFQAKKTLLANQGEKSRMASAQQAVQQFASSWGNAFARLLTFQAGFGETFKSLWSGLMGIIGGIISQVIEQMVVQWLTAHGVMKAISKLFGIGEIAASAGKAGAAAWASTAAIPIIGPALAPAAAATAAAGAASFGSFLMAEQGFDVPAGVNPMTQLHQKEMVLPAQYADVIRGMAGQGGSKSSGGDTYHVSMMDTRGAEEFLKRNAHHVVAAVKSGVRNGSR